MKPLIQKLPLSESTSFVAKSFRTPDFEVGWHQHIEYELILFTEGSGMSFIGNHVGEFEAGDIYFLACNLPHTFQKRKADMITSAIVVQFREDFWGKDFMNMPEARLIKQLCTASMEGIKLQGGLKHDVSVLIRKLENAAGFRRVLLLASCLELIAASSEWSTVSTQDIKPNTPDERIDKVFQFTIDNFREPIQLSQVAKLACMSIQTFCTYFKRCTKKTYIDFLNEVRIGYACNLLLDSKKSVLEICYASGYNTMAHFHKQFLRVKGNTPLQYRKAFSPDVIKQGRNIGIEV